MTKPKNYNASINERHLTGFRRFQNAALARSVRVVNEPPAGAERARIKRKPKPP